MAKSTRKSRAGKAAASQVCGHVFWQGKEVGETGSFTSLSAVGGRRPDVHVGLAKMLAPAQSAVAPVYPC
jgi:hypothetical protein